METVSKRELNQNTAAVLGRVTDSVDVVVTERGVPRWRVSVFRGPDDKLARLEREGHYTPPSPSPAPWPADPGGREISDAEVTALLDEMRGEH